jgi:hypothetical protein
LPGRKKKGRSSLEITHKKVILIMTNPTGERQEAAWPLPKQKHLLQRLVSLVKKRARRKLLVS